MSEETCEFVSSRGLLKRCDVYPPNPTSSTRSCYSHDWASLKPGATVYIHGSAMPHFIRAVWPIVNVPIVIVSGDCDQTMPIDAFFSEHHFIAFLEDPRLIAWFSQNQIAVTAHPKVHSIPIGLDYHTLSVQEGHPWGSQQSPKEQEEDLILFRNAAPSDRILKAYANFQFSMNTPFAKDRQEAIEQLDKELVVYEETPVKRLVTWSKQTNYQFVISPHGGGLDCHRTWEALALGCYPIVRVSPIVNLFKGLPVLIVNSWKDVTPELLRSFTEFWKKRPPPYEQLYLRFWTDRIREAVTDALLASSPESKE
jgi:hypothetical protein